MHTEPTLIGAAPRPRQTIDLLGPRIQVVTALDGSDETPCVLVGTIPGGGMVPLHSHPDPETFVTRAGTVEALLSLHDGPRWVALVPGDVLHIPAGVRHAFRNRCADAAVSVVVTTTRLGRFFGEAGAAVLDAPGPAAVRHFLAVAERYGHWNATPAQNAEVGLEL